MMHELIASVCRTTWWENSIYSSKILATTNKLLKTAEQKCLQHEEGSSVVQLGTLMTLHMIMICYLNQHDSLKEKSNIVPAISWICLVVFLLIITILTSSLKLSAALYHSHVWCNFKKTHANNTNKTSSSIWQRLSRIEWKRNQPLQVEQTRIDMKLTCEKCLFGVLCGILMYLMSASEQTKTYISNILYLNIVNIFIFF